jgi:nucleotide-binding universal stress UspA family protein
VDFQSDARSALEYAQALAPQARLNLVHVYRFPFEGKMRYSGVPDDLIGFYRAEARAAASRCMRELVSSRVSSNAVNPLIVHGDAVATLLDKERELNADLIVLTRRNKSLTEELLLESVTSKLLERSRCDVLVMN